MPKDMLRAMVALDQAHRKQPGATVEVIGYDDETALKLLSLQVMERFMKEYRPIDKRGHQELFTFMNQNPARPGLGMSVPMLAGGKVTRPDDKWLR